MSGCCSEQTPLISSWAVLFRVDFRFSGQSYILSISGPMCIFCFLSYSSNWSRLWLQFCSFLVEQSQAILGFQACSRNLKGACYSNNAFNMVSCIVVMYIQFWKRIVVHGTSPISNRVGFNLCYFQWNYFRIREYFLVCCVCYRCLQFFQVECHLVNLVLCSIDSNCYFSTIDPSTLSL